MSAVERTTTLNQLCSFQPKHSYVNEIPYHKGKRKVGGEDRCTKCTSYIYLKMKRTACKNNVEIKSQQQVRLFFQVICPVFCESRV